jgi:hypothetical protein
MTDTPPPPPPPAAAAAAKNGSRVYAKADVGGCELHEDLTAASTVAVPTRLAPN